MEFIWPNFKIIVVHANLLFPVYPGLRVAKLQSTILMVSFPRKSENSHFEKLNSLDRFLRSYLRILDIVRIVNIQSSIITPCCRTRLRIKWCEFYPEDCTVVGTFGERFLPDAFFAGTLDKVSDFEIVFEFKIFFGHCSNFFKLYY